MSFISFVKLKFIVVLFKLNANIYNCDIFLVSMGGTIGLFLGASLLSIVELIYYFCVRRKLIIENTDQIVSSYSKLNKDVVQLLKMQKKKSEKIIPVKPFNMVIPYLP